MKADPQIKRDSVLRNAGKDLADHVQGLFARCPALWGFTVQGDLDELAVGDVGIMPSLSAEQYAEVYQEIVRTLGTLLAERPETALLLQGRTFARTLH